MVWIYFIVDLLVVVFVFYDCTALGPGIPGFGNFDFMTTVFGYVNMNHEILMTRLMVWSLAAFSISTTTSLGAQVFVCGAVAYFVLYIILGKWPLLFFVLFLSAFKYVYYYEFLELQPSIYLTQLRASFMHQKLVMR